MILLPKQNFPCNSKKIKLHFNNNNSNPDINLELSVGPIQLISTSEINVSKVVLHQQMSHRTIFEQLNAETLNYPAFKLTVGNFGQQFGPEPITKMKCFVSMVCLVRIIFRTTGLSMKKTKFPFRSSFPLLCLPSFPTNR